MPNQKGNIALIILGIVAIAIVAGGAGYFVVKKPAQKEEQKQEKQTNQQQIQQEQQKSISEITEQKTEQPEAKDKMADWKTYRNEKYGFELTLTDLWSGFRVFERENNAPYEPSGVINFVFMIPTVDKLAVDFDGDEGWWAPMNISIWPKLDWDKRKKDVENNPTLGWMPGIIGESDLYVFSLSRPSEVPHDFNGKNLGYDKIIYSFKFTK